METLIGYILGLIATHLQLWFNIWFNNRTKNKEIEEEQDHIQTIGGIKFIVDDRDEIFRKENETIIVDKSKKLKYAIPNTSILYIQEGTEKN